MPIQLAITRRVRSGHDAEFQQALREFFRASFAHDGVYGANMIVPPPGSEAREYGILRTFANEGERDAFYASALFKDWDERVRPLTEGEPVHRQLHGLEAWFRTSGNSPARWKMAGVTFVGAYTVSLFLGVLIGPFTGSWPLPLRTAVFTALMVAGLTWVIMPFLTKVTSAWLNRPAQIPATSK